MNKKIRKILSSFFPKGVLKEQIKLIVYNLSRKTTNFGIDGEFFSTEFEQKYFLTTSPLYRIVDDFKFYTHFYQPQPSDIIIDAGANNGFISLYFASLLDDTGSVWAFEPDSINSNIITKNKTLNPKFSSRINIVNLLLWNKDGEIEFCESGTVGSSVHYISDKNKLVNKKAITLDKWIIENGIPKVDFIKMDIEGAEVEAIEGCIDTINKFSPNFAIASYHVINGRPTYIELENFFNKIKYPYKTLHFKNNETITYAGPKCLKQ